MSSAWATKIMLACFLIIQLFSGYLCQVYERKVTEESVPGLELTKKKEQKSKEEKAQQEKDSKPKKQVRRW